MSKEISAFEFNGVSFSWDGDNAYIDQGEDSIETDVDTITRSAIQWLLLHDPDVIAKGD